MVASGLRNNREENITITEQNREIVERLREEGVHAVCGDASDPAVLIQAHVARAAMLVIATPDTLDVRKMIEVARKLNPKILIVLRTHDDEEVTLLRQEHAGEVFMGERELARAMTQPCVVENEKGRNRSNDLGARLALTSRDDGATASGGFVARSTAHAGWAVSDHRQAVVARLESEPS